MRPPKRLKWPARACLLFVLATAAPPVVRLPTVAAAPAASNTRTAAESGTPPSGQSQPSDQPQQSEQSRRPSEPPPRPTPAPQPPQPPLLRKFPLRESGLKIERPSRSGVFYDAAGRRAALFGYEHRRAEAWVYPLKILDGLEPSFRIEGYPLEFAGADTLARISARPEATVFTYSHAAFTVRQTVFVPHDEPAVVMLFEVESALPLTLSVSFRPRLRLSWPAGLMTGGLSWDERARAYFITEESKRYVGVVGCPRARDVSVMPYQEEPRDVPARFTVETTPEEARTSFVPVVIAGGIEGREQARATYERVLRSIPSLYERTVAHYEQLLDETTRIETPDPRFDEAFAWAKVGIDKGVVTSPLLGTGLVAGYRTSGESERPGFAWYFGRDSLWTALATTSYGDWRTTRAALDFLRKFQRADGKVPHEISQSASLLPWFTDYKYAWDSADATPLYVIAHADYWRASGDDEYLRANWQSILRAYRFTEATDKDGDGLVENTDFGHGWVEGGDLYPPHEEIYMQGLWIEASRAFAEMAAALNEDELRARASASAERTRAATEKTYWLAPQGFYAYATKRPTAEPVEAEKGPSRAARQARLNELRGATLFEEDTILPAVPLWFKTLSDERAQAQIDRLGSAALATDWGARILSAGSRLYDPLSYHHGSVWPLFTGWASLAAYNYGRPHVGYQALMANALLTYQGSPGHVTELLSGDFNAPFGRSSHHQIWSQAMVAAPALRGLLGIETGAGGAELRIAPQPPANWRELKVENIRAGGALYTFSMSRTNTATLLTLTTRHAASTRPPAQQGAQRGAPVQSPAAALPPAALTPATPTSAAARMTVSAQTLASAPASAPDGPTPSKVVLAPSLPLDARVVSATVNGRPARFNVLRTGDVQRVEITLDRPAQTSTVRITHEPGTDFVAPAEMPEAGAQSSGLRLLRVRAEASGVRLLAEGRAGRTYLLDYETPKTLRDAEGIKTLPAAADRKTKLALTFPAGTDGYVRREFFAPFAPAR